MKQCSRGVPLYSRAERGGDWGAFIGPGGPKELVMTGSWAQADSKKKNRNR